MNILLVAATTEELPTNIHEQFPMHNIELMIHGVGLMMCSYHLGHYFAKCTPPDLAIQIGIAGTFDKRLALGDVVVVANELLGDTGAEDHDTYHDIFDLGLIDNHQFPFQNKQLTNHHTSLFPSHLKRVNAITVNMASGSLATVQRRQALHIDIESMEGAAFHYAALCTDIPFIQLRAISNQVEPRDKSKWNISLALSNLHSELVSFIQHLPSS